MKSHTTRTRERSASLSTAARYADVRMGAASSALGPRKRSSEARISMSMQYLEAPHFYTNPPGNTGAFEDFRNGVFPIEGHHVDARHARNGLHLGNDLATQFEAFVRHAVGGHAAKSTYNFVGHVHARHFLAHVLECAQRPDRTNAGENEAPFFESQVAYLLHPVCEDLDIEDELRLAELRSGGDLLAEAFGAPLERRREWIFNRANEPVGRRLEVATGEQLALLAHGARGPDQLDRVEIEDRFGVWMVAKARMVAGQQ